MKEIQIFKNEMFGEMRTLTNEKGETFFVGKDVAKALGYVKPENAIATHVDDDDKTTTLIQGTGVKYKSKTTIINESGLYSLVLSSKLPQAKVFKRWVTSEVLPQIRQTGGYLPTRNPQTGEALTESEMVEAASMIMARTISRGNLPADDCLTATQVAQSLDIDVLTLNHFLVDQGVMRWSCGRYQLTHRYADCGYAEERRFHYFALDGARKLRTYLVWTPQGKNFIKSLIEN